VRCLIGVSGHTHCGMQREGKKEKTGKTRQGTTGGPLGVMLIIKNSLSGRAGG
jgi:hypothetical protein